MRILAGEKKGMTLECPRGMQTRPTLSRVRESLFMVLDGRLEGARVLDLFAGAGGLGLEALSRGAAHATLVDQSQSAIRSLAINVRKLELRDRVEIEKAEVFRFLGRPRTGEPFDLVFLDPPYGEMLAHRALEKLDRVGDSLLAPGALVVVQVGRRDPIESAYGRLESGFSRIYGETRIDLYDWAGSEPGRACGGESDGSSGDGA